MPLDDKIRAAIIGELVRQTRHQRDRRERLAPIVRRIARREQHRAGEHYKINGPAMRAGPLSHFASKYAIAQPRWVLKNAMVFAHASFACVG